MTLRFLGLGYTAAVETVFGLSIVGSAAAMYGFVRSWAGRHAAISAALVYVYLPYHLLNLYVRANLAESMAFVWLPLCLWAVRQAVIRPSVWAVIGCAVSYAGLMLTSNLVIVLFTPLLALYTLVLIGVYALPPGALRSTVGRRLLAWLRAALAPGLGILAGLGLLMGTAFPLGMKVALVRSSSLAPLLFGINAAAGVLASILAVVISLSWGISLSYWAGVVCYLIALFAFVWACLSEGYSIVPRPEKIDSGSADAIEVEAQPVE